MSPTPSHTAAPRNRAPRSDTAASATSAISPTCASSLDARTEGPSSRSHLFLLDEAAGAVVAQLEWYRPSVSKPNRNKMMEAGLTARHPGVAGLLQRLRLKSCGSGCAQLVPIPSYRLTAQRMRSSGSFVSGQSSGSYVRIRRRETSQPGEDCSPGHGEAAHVYAPDLVLVPSSRDAEIHPAPAISLVRSWTSLDPVSAAAVPADDTKRAVYGSAFPMRSICSSGVSMKRASSPAAPGRGYCGSKVWNRNTLHPLTNGRWASTRRFPSVVKRMSASCFSRIGRLQEKRKSRRVGLRPPHPSGSSEGGTGCGPPSSPSRALIVGFCGLKAEPRPSEPAD